MQARLKEGSIYLNIKNLTRAHISLLLTDVRLLYIHLPCALLMTIAGRIPRDKASLLISVQLPLAHAKEGIFINKLKQKLDNHFDQQRAREIEAERQAQIEAQNARLHVRCLSRFFTRYHKRDLLALEHV